MIIVGIVIDVIGALLQQHINISALSQIFKSGYSIVKVLSIYKPQTRGTAIALKCAGSTLSNGISYLQIDAAVALIQLFEPKRYCVK